MSSASSSSSSSSSSKEDFSTTHEVYISSQKDDPVSYFTDMIGKGLVTRGILRTFQDKNQQRQKQQGNLGRELREAISMSKMAIVLCTNNYFGSSWCLEELVAILRCREKWGLIVLPIFFDVNPSDMRHLRGDIGKLVSGQTKGGPWYGRWKSAMKQTADFSGWVVQGDRGSQSMLVGNIIVDIEDGNIPTNLHISIYPFRYDNFDQYLKLFLQVGIDDVHIVGIYGPSGMGKTAIAQAVYDQIFYTFDGSCFLPNVGENSRKPDGLALLQQKLLSEVLPGKELEVPNTTMGMDLIKENLTFKRVLVVLDDVDHMDQLYSLAGNRSWFGCGSKIIITTRKSYLLNEIGVDQVFVAQGLPLPSNIKAFWNQFQQSRRVIARLKQSIQLLHQQTIKKQTCLKIQLLKERQKNFLQEKVLEELEQAQDQNFGLLEPKSEALQLTNMQS